MHEQFAPANNVDQHLALTTTCHDAAKWKGALPLGLDFHLLMEDTAHLTGKGSADLMEVHVDLLCCDVRQQVGDGITVPESPLDYGS